MQSYIAVAAGMVLLSVVLSLIIPEGKLNKIINFILRLACILVLIQPITQLFNINLSDDGSSLIDYEWITSVYTQTQNTALTKAIYEKFEVECDCDVDYTYVDGKFVENSVTITINNCNDQTKNSIYEYLKGLGYIHINVNERTD
jgi:hypothetical protein